MGGVVYPFVNDKGFVCTGELKKGDETLIVARSLLKNRNLHKSPARYTEAFMSYEMEEKNIGRPSTYSK